MKSIQRSFVILTLATVLLLAAVLGSVSVFALVSNANANAATEINLTCANEASQIDMTLKGIQDSVGIETEFVVSKLAEMEEAAPSATEDDNAARYAEWLEESSNLFASIAKYTNDVIFYYVRLGDSGADSTGFFFLRDNTDEEFRSVPVGGQGGKLPGESDEDGVGWDDAALREGTSLWLLPYNVDGLGISMETYLSPIIVNGEYRGVVGMGVDFNSVVERVQSINSFESGYGFLTDAECRIMYHPTIEAGTDLMSTEDGDPAANASIIAGSTPTDEVLVYRYHDADKRMAVCALQNGMRLVLAVDASEIYANRDKLAWTLVLITIVAAVAFVAASIARSRRALQPLRELTIAAEKIADGDLDVEVPRSETREVMGLVRAYDRTVNELKDQIATIDDLAHRDALTGLLNKAAYNEIEDGLNRRIAAGENCHFALAMLDVNGLKSVNDSQGHEAGDELLKRAAAAIVDAFGKTPVYRVGGDEFVVLMTDGVVRLDAVDNGEVSLACGIAEYRAGEDEDVASVLKRADSRMYSFKRASE